MRFSSQEGYAWK